MLTNIGKTCVIEKINLYFLKSRKMANFFQNFDIFNMITDFFLVEKRRTLQGARSCICKTLLNLDCQDSICLSVTQVAYK